MNAKLNIAKQPEAKTAASQIRPPGPAQAPVESSYDRVLDLQKTVGNQSVQQWMRSTPIQAKLSISGPRDDCEREADQIAERFTDLPEAPYAAPECMHRNCIRAFSQPGNAFPGNVPSTLGPKLHREQIGTRASGDSISAIAPQIETRLQNAEGFGRPLPDGVRALFEPQFDRDFSQVRVHIDPEAGRLARDLRARAFTRAEHIF
ncbi:MAG: DUF4157 domain-containing protein, partial [Desulfobacteraceae bacterium]